MENSVELDIPKFNTFLRVLNLFKDIANDVIIHDGVIRQKTNDKFSVFEIDLKPILGSLSLPINLIKNKFDIFKSFSNNAIVISTTGTSYIFTDAYSRIEFKNPFEAMLTNTYLQLEDLVDSESESNDNLILSTTINKVITNRMKVTSQSFDTNVVKVLFEDGEAKICSVKASKNDNAVFMKGITTERVIDGECNISVSPFIFDHDNDLILKIYQSGTNKILCVFSSIIDDVNVKVYTRAMISTKE